VKLTEKNNAEAPTLADDLPERLRSWAQNEEMIDSYYTTHGRDCNEAAARIESDAKRIRALEAENARLQYGEPPKMTEALRGLRDHLAASRERERALRKMFKDGYVLALYDDHGSQVNAWHSPEEFIATIATPDSAPTGEAK
jgi:hypothetical protein